MSPHVSDPTVEEVLHRIGFCDRVAHSGDFRQALLLMVLYSIVISRLPTRLPLNSHGRIGCRQWKHHFRTAGGNKYLLGHNAMVVNLEKRRLPSDRACDIQ
jgi:hypothetical protein